MTKDVRKNINALAADLATKTSQIAQARKGKGYQYKHNKDCEWFREFLRDYIEPIEYFYNYPIEVSVWTDM